jgi:hypothetical protein
MKTLLFLLSLIVSTNLTAKCQVSTITDTADHYVPGLYNISYFEGDTFIDGTQIDELDEELVWDLYKEFEHVRTTNTRFEVEEIFDKD